MDTVEVHTGNQATPVSDMAAKTEHRDWLSRTLDTLETEQLARGQALRAAIVLAQSFKTLHVPSRAYRLLHEALVEAGFKI